MDERAWIKNVPTLPQFKVLKWGEEPPRSEHHILLVHKISADRRALVHEISGHLPPSARSPRYLTGPDAFTGSPGDALQEADRMATEYGAPIVYVRDDTAG